MLHVVLSPQTSNRPVLQSPPVCVMVVMVVVVKPRPGCVSTRSVTAGTSFEFQLSSHPVLEPPTSSSLTSDAEVLATDSSGWCVTVVCSITRSFWHPERSVAREGEGEQGVSRNEEVEGGVDTSPARGCVCRSR